MSLSPNGSGDWLETLALGSAVAVSFITISSLCYQLALFRKVWYSKFTSVFECVNSYRKFNFTSCVGVASTANIDQTDLLYP